MQHMRTIVLGIGLVVIGLTLYIIIKQTLQTGRLPMEPSQANANLRLASSAFADNQPIPDRYTCRGDNINPPLTITNVPTGSQSLVLIVHDPDAASGDWVHWLAWNLPPTLTDIGENGLPDGATQGTTSFGKTGYGGPCPPKGTGTHRYMFELYALDIPLQLSSNADRAQLLQAMQGHTLTQTTLTGTVAAEP